MIQRRSNIKGVDTLIDQFQLNLYNKLIAKWGLTGNESKYECYPRCYRNQTDDGYIPEVKINSSNEYKEVLWNDTLSAISFFGTGEETAFEIWATADIHLIFFVNVEALKPGAERRDEEIKLDVMKVVETGYCNFLLKSITTGIDNVFKEYSGFRISEGL